MLLNLIKAVLFGLFCFSVTSFAQEESTELWHLDQGKLCQSYGEAKHNLIAITTPESVNKNEQPVLLQADFERLCEKDEQKERTPRFFRILFPKSAYSKRRLLVKITMGPTRTSYLPSNIMLNSSNVKGMAYQVPITERHSMEYYEVWNAKGTDVFRFLDEPSNTYQLELEKEDNYVLGLRLFHPKILIGNGEDFNGQKITVVDGTGRAQSLNYQDAFQEFQFTQGFLNIELYADKVIPLLLRKWGKLTWHLGVGGGLYIGHVSAATMDGTGKVSSFSTRLKPIGGSFSISNSLHFSFCKDWLGVYIRHTFSAGGLNFEFYDGIGTMGFNYHRYDAGLSVTLFKSRPPKKMP